MKQPLVSVIIPCYQHGSLLGETVHSVLAQRDVRVEIIIVNDGSIDNTGQVADDLQRDHPEMIRLIRQSNQGQAAARENGLEKAHGDIVCLLDSDDMLEVDAIANAVDIFEKYPSAHVVAGDALMVDHDNQMILRIFLQFRKPAWPKILEKNPYGAPSAIFIKREALEWVGGVHAGVDVGAEDWDLWARMARCGLDFIAAGKPFARYRQSVSSHSHDPLAGLKPYLQMLEFASTDDARLDKYSWGEIHPPISLARKAVYANTRVFFHLGKSIGMGGDVNQWKKILSCLEPGGLDLRKCSDQFLEGMHFIGIGSQLDAASLAGLKNPFVEQVAFYLLADHSEKSVQKMVGKILKSLNNPQRKRSLLTRLQERVSWLH